MTWLRSLFSHPSAYPDSDLPPALAADLLEAEQMTSELTDYLFGDRLFRQIVVETPLGTRQPKMTLGGLWERIEHLQATPELGQGDLERLASVKMAWEEARRRYPDRFRDKLRRELDSYLKNWKYYLDQVRQDPERWQSEREVEIRNRQRVEMILRLLGPDAPPGLLDDLAKSDE